MYARGSRRAGERIGQSQVGFIEVVALPLFTTLVEAVPAAKTQLEAAQKNRDYWMNFMVRPMHLHPGFTPGSPRLVSALEARMR